MKWFLLILLGMPVLAMAQGPQPKVPSSEPEPRGSHPGFEAFKKDLYYPILRKQCITCHDSQTANSVHGPPHSDSDPWLAYTTSQREAYFQNIPSSRFVTYGTNGHQSTYGVNVTVTKDQLIQALNQWWLDGEIKASSLEGKKILAAQNLPNLPSNGDYVTMQWDLGEVNPELQGMKFQIDVQRFVEAESNHAGADQFANPRLEIKGKTVRVQGVYFLVNGRSYAWADNFANINMVVQSQTILAGRPQIIIDDKGPKTDKIAIAFDNIALAAPGEKAQAGFGTANSTAPSKALSQMLPTVQINQAKALQAFDESKMGVSAHFVKIKATEFDMGSLAGDPQRFDNENLHRVKLSKDFEIQATDVTQVQWFLIMGQNPSSFQNKENCDPNNYFEVTVGATTSASKPSASCPSGQSLASGVCTATTGGSQIKMCAYHPVEQVSWDAVQGFIKKLNTIQTGYTYRLPTEAEWEYVAHGGLPPEYSYPYGSDFDGAYAWFSGNSNNRTHQVGTKQPTHSPSQPQDLLYDMSGNVWQWVQDWYGDYPKTAVLDPAGPLQGSVRVLRGGSWYDLARFLRPAFRDYHGPGDRVYNIGFRLVRTPKK